MEVFCLVCGGPVPRVSAQRLATGHGKYCTRACYLNRSDVTAPERFWAKVEMGNECWVWIGRRDADGYGKFEPRPQRPMFAHRYSYYLAYGPIPPGMLICHSCDNPPCVRPSHLFAGSNSDNQRDAARKGRMASGLQNGAHVKPERVLRGESHGSAKLTTANVIAIRARSDAGEKRITLAREFGVDRSLIGLIAKRQSWAHVPEHATVPIP